CWYLRRYRRDTFDAVSVSAPRCDSEMLQCTSFDSSSCRGDCLGFLLDGEKQIYGCRVEGCQATGYAMSVKPFSIHTVHLISGSLAVRLGALTLAYLYKWFNRVMTN